MIYIVKQIDFDIWENHDPEDESILGYCHTKKEADEIVEQKTKTTKKFKGWNGKEYPIFKVEKIKKLKA